MTARTSARTLRLGTRGSRLALLQAQQVAALLREAAPAVEVSLSTVSTQGDQQADAPLLELAGQEGVFTRGVELEVLAGRVDFAVHSLKDVPTETDPRLVLAAYPGRANPLDVIVSRCSAGFDDLPPRARLGTSSPRRRAQVLARRPDLRVMPIRGNVDTRLAKLRAGEVDALVLAAAGLERLGRLAEAAAFLPGDRFTPAAGQGALVAQCRAADRQTIELLAKIDHQPTRAAVTAERAFLRAVGGGCRVPVAAYAEIVGDQLRLHGFLADVDGRAVRSGQLVGQPDQPEALGQELAERLLAGAPEGFLSEVRRG